jgi:small subunit ribosomal protein S3
MGQKTHPGGFRLNTTQEHYSSWCQKNWKNYSINLKRDYKIRTAIENALDTTNISKIGIRQNYALKRLYINIFVEKPILALKKIESTDLQIQIQQIIKISTRYSINLYRVEEPDADATILAEYITDMLEKRVAFKRSIRKTIDLAEQNPFVRGIKIQISGRLNGAEIARSEWVKEGRMPLQTLRAQISYISKTAKTMYGILGVKVWVFKGEQIK